MIDVKSLDELVDLLFSGYAGELRYNQYVLRNQTIYYDVVGSGKLRNLLRLHEGRVLVEYTKQGLRHLKRFLPLLVSRVKKPQKDIFFVLQLFPELDPVNRDDETHHERTLLAVLVTTIQTPALRKLLDALGIDPLLSLYHYAQAHGIVQQLYDVIDEHLYDDLFTREPPDPTSPHYHYYPKDDSVDEETQGIYRGFERRMKLRLLLDEPGD